MSQKYAISLIGSGNWASATALLIGKNTSNKPEFHNSVKMFVHEEIIDGQKLSSIIANTHENVKYLPRVTLPDNIIPIPNLKECVEYADILVMALPEQFLRGILTEMKLFQLKPDSFAVSLIKGFEFVQDSGSRDGLLLMSDIISRSLGIPCMAMMGANIAKDVAKDQFTESTIGVTDPKYGDILKDLFQTDNFRISITPDLHTVELCGAMKNIIATGAGFIEGMGLGANTRATLIRLGFLEMWWFVRCFSPNQAKFQTMLEGCGIADLIATATDGRNRMVAKEFAKINYSPSGARNSLISSEKSSVSVSELSEELLNGQSLQGAIAASHVAKYLEQQGLADKCPIMVLVSKIYDLTASFDDLLEAMKHHPIYNDPVSYTIED